VRAFHAVGFANQPTSIARGDGLSYRDLYLTAAVRCAPPGNQPSAAETANCAPYLERELRLLREARAVLALGGFAWTAVQSAAARVYGVEVPRAAFAHGACVALGPGRPLLWASYHPSPQNTNTGKLTPAMLTGLLERIRASYEGAPPPPAARGGPGIPGGRER
jgi:uracil-DNA glycosylase